MDAKTFESKAQGDFYLYYRKSGSNQTTYLTGTRDLHESHYIEERLPRSASQKNENGTYKVVTNEDGSLYVNPKGGVTVWSWNSDKLRVLPLSRITRVIPLSSVLRNN
jgi:predicted lipoprotein with Yx(FWY)xxD motif